MNNKNEQNTDLGVMFLAISVLIGAAYLKFYSQIWIAYHFLRYPIAVVITLIIMFGYLKIKLKLTKAIFGDQNEKDTFEPVDGESATFMGFANSGKRVYLQDALRINHMQVVGTTNAGKTESVIVPLAVSDIKQGRGFVLIDGKSDLKLLDKLYAYAKKHRREADFKIFSIVDLGISCTINPLKGGNALEITERVINALDFENKYYKDIQTDVFLHMMLIFEGAKVTPTFMKVVDCLQFPDLLIELSHKTENERLQRWAMEHKALSNVEREIRVSGLKAQLQPFTVGELAKIFNSELPDLVLEDVVENNQIVYCQLPVLKVKTLGTVTAKLILEGLKGAISSRHLGTAQNRKLFSIFLDDFTEYLTEGFSTLLNKSRSANVGVVFAHQALGDLDRVDEGIKNAILTNSNIKVFMATNEPTSAEYYASVIGTSLTEKVTTRQKDGIFGPNKTGEGSVRETEEFRFHPNIFKQDLKTGEGVIVIPGPHGRMARRMKFAMIPNIQAEEIPNTYKPEPTAMELKKIEAASKTKAETDQGQNPPVPQQGSGIAKMVEAAEAKSSDAMAAA
jgi:type IV secretory pathway TraG/TraD family ATPase VirD4